jgi:hypothetical protein
MSAEALVNEFTGPVIIECASQEGVLKSGGTASDAAQQLLAQCGSLEAARLAVKSFVDHRLLTRLETHVDRWNRQRELTVRISKWAGTIAVSIFGLASGALAFFGYDKYTDMKTSVDKAVAEVMRIKTQADADLQKMHDEREHVTDHAFHISSEIGSLFRRADGMDEEMRSRFARNTEEFQQLKASFARQIEQIVIDHTRLDIETLMTELDDAIQLSLRSDFEASVRQARELQTVNLITQRMHLPEQRDRTDTLTTEQKAIVALRRLADLIEDLSRVRSETYQEGKTRTITGEQATERSKDLENKLNALEHRAKGLRFESALFGGLHAATDDPKTESQFPARAEAFRTLALAYIPHLRFIGLDRRQAADGLADGERYLKEVIDGTNSIEWQARVTWAVLRLDRAESAKEKTSDLLTEAIDQLETAMKLADSPAKRAQTANNLADACYKIATRDFEEGKAAGPFGGTKRTSARQFLEKSQRAIRVALRDGTLSSIFTVYCATNAEILSTSVIFENAKWKAAAVDERDKMFRAVCEQIERSQGVYEVFGFDSVTFFAKNPVYEQMARILAGNDSKRIDAYKRDVLTAAHLINP